LYQGAALEFVPAGFEKLGDFIWALHEVSEVRVFEEIVLEVFLFHVGCGWVIKGKEEFY